MVFSKEKKDAQVERWRGVGDKKIHIKDEYFRDYSRYQKK